MNEKKNSIFQEFSQNQEKNQWMVIYQVCESPERGWRKVLMLFVVSSTQNIKDESDAEAKRCNFTTSESKKAQNRRLNR